MAFPDTWKLLQTNLSVGTVIPNWTVHSGPIGEPFTITEVSATVVVIDAPGAEAPQRVSRDDFQEIYDRWDDYLHGGLARSEFLPLTRYSKYVISILHLLAERTDAVLP